MKVIHKGCKFFDRVLATGKGPGNVIDVSFILAGFGSCVLTKDLLLCVTHEKTSIVGPKSASHCNPSDLIILLPIERESIQGENYFSEVDNYMSGLLKNRSLVLEMLKC